MKKALIDMDDQVVNLIEIESSAEYAPPPGLRLTNEDASPAVIGGTWDGVNFVDPVAPASTYIEDLLDKLRYGEITTSEIEDLLRLRLRLTDGPPDVRPVDDTESPEGE